MLRSLVLLVAAVAPLAVHTTARHPQRGLLQTLGSMPTSFTLPTSEVPTEPSGCSTAMAACTGEFETVRHEVAGDVTVIDDCTFRVRNWEFDGLGPAVEWWADTAQGDPDAFPYSAASRKIGEIGTPGNYLAGAHTTLFICRMCERSELCANRIGAGVDMSTAERLQAAATAAPATSPCASAGTRAARRCC